MPDIDPLTNSIFPPETNKLCFIVLHESFDKKNLCLNSMFSIATESSKRLEILMHVSYHPEDDEMAVMDHMRELDDPNLTLIMDTSSPSETDMGRAVTVGWALKEMFGQTTVTMRLKVVLCCGEDVDYDQAKEMYEYVNERHPCYFVYGSDQMRAVSSSVNFFSKWKLRNTKAVVPVSGSINM